MFDIVISYFERYQIKKLLVLLLVLVLLIQIYNIFISHATYDWAFIGGLFAMLFIFAFLYVLIGYGRIVQSFKSKKYDYVISKENCFLGKNTALKDNILYMVAISHLEQGNVADFSRCVDKIEDSKLYLTKCFLEIISSVISKDRANQLKWEEEYSKNANCSQKDRYDAILDLVRKSQIEGYEWSVEELAIIESIEINSIKKVITDKSN
jgi:hypothetical protein